MLRDKSTKLFGKTNKKRLKINTKPPEEVKSPINTPSIMEIILDENPYLAQNIFEQADEDFSIGEDEIQPMIDILTDQRNSALTTIAFLKTRNRTLLHALAGQNKYLADLKSSYDRLEASNNALDEKIKEYDAKVESLLNDLKKEE